MYNHEEMQYLRIMKRLISEGHYREGRNGFTRSLFGEQMRFDLANGFPLLTSKKIFFHGIKTELLWFLKGSSNINYLLDHGVHIWDKWADEKGDLGPVYGVQWRNWNTMKNDDGRQLDQIANVIAGLKADPYGRRHIVTAWNPAEVDEMALPPCHCLFQFHVANGRLSCHLYQRSADWFIGVPFNIASYALLTHLVARECGFEVGEFIHSFGDLHLYEIHKEVAIEQIARPTRRFPDLIVPPWSKEKTIFDLEPDDIKVVAYHHEAEIKAEVVA